MTGLAAAWFFEDLNKPEDLRWIWEWPRTRGSSAGRKVPMRIGDFDNPKPWGFNCTLMTRPDLVRTSFKAQLMINGDLDADAGILYGELLEKAFRCIIDEIMGSSFPAEVSQVRTYMTEPASWNESTGNASLNYLQNAVDAVRKQLENDQQGSYNILFKEAQRWKNESLCSAFATQALWELGPDKYTLILDLGGSTTDSCFVRSIHREKIELVDDQSKNHGASKVDESFAKKVQQEFSGEPNLTQLIARFLDGNWDIVKREFVEGKSTVYKIHAGDLSLDLRSEDAVALFKIYVQGLESWLNEILKGQKVNKVVLTGGGSQYPHVVSRIKSALAKLDFVDSESHVVVAEEPRLSVAKGLAYDIGTSNGKSSLREPSPTVISG